MRRVWVLALGVFVIVALLWAVRDRKEPMPASARVPLVCGVPTEVFDQQAEPLADESASEEVRDDPSLIGDSVPSLWRLYEDGDTRTYLAGEPPTLHTTTLRREGAAWRWAGGGGCTTFVDPPGRAGASWKLTAALDPNATEFAVLASDRQCASGRPADERVGEAQVVETAATVMVTFTATQLTGNQNCPGHASARRVVRLRAPLGPRVLLDGGLYPAQPACAAEPTRPQPDYCNTFG